MASPQPALRQSRAPHIHVAGERCPVCDQPIPNEKAEEVRARMEARDRAAVEQVRREGAEALQRARGEIAAKEAAARAAGKKEAEAALQERLTAAERARAEAESVAKQRIATLELAGRQRDADWQEKMSAAERDKQAAVEQLESMKANQEETVRDQVQEVREAMEKDKAATVNAERAKHFEERQKLTDKLEDLKRQLEKKTAHELGEGAEVDLFEALKGEFENDKIERIGKGTPGADIRHVVIHNGKECGTILYDSKNRRRWDPDYVDKLARDQRAAKAEAAILSTLKFPEKTRQVYVDRGTGIIIANPARVLALVQVLRKYLVHVHTLRLSNTERDKKTAALYDFITSERCAQLLDSIDMHAETLLDLQAKEKRSHESIWKHQGTLYRSIPEGPRGPRRGDRPHH